MHGRPRPANFLSLLSGLLAAFAFFFAFLLDLARQLAAAAEQLTRQRRANAQKLAAQNTELLFAARPFANGFHLVSTQRLAVHDAALSRYLFVILFFRDFDDFFGQRNDVFAAPNQSHRALRVFKRPLEPSAFGRTPRKAVLYDQQLDILLSQPLP